MKTLLPHEQRVVEERNELLDKIQKLKAFFDTPVFKTMLDVERQLLREQETYMTQYAYTLETRIYRFSGFKTYRVRSTGVLAVDMTREEYCKLRGWTVPANENPEDAGKLIEFCNVGNPIHPDYQNYITWMSNEVFDMMYKLSGDQNE